MSKNRVPIVTDDGSSTIYIPEWNESYHSRHGAISESKHVFIENGIAVLREHNTIKVVEVGFGTGLNALLTYDFARNFNVKVEYHAIEPFPLGQEICNALDYPMQMKQKELVGIQEQMHSSDNAVIDINQHFQLHRYKAKLLDLLNKIIEADIVYYDAFGPRVQSEMWEFENLHAVDKMLRPGGILVTYCAQGEFKRILKQLGYVIERLKGPPGKREMTRATKNEE